MATTDDWQDPCHTADILREMYGPDRSGIPCEEFGMPTTYRGRWTPQQGKLDHLEYLCIEELGDLYPGKAQSLPSCEEYDAQVAEILTLAGLPPKPAYGSYAPLYGPTTVNTGGGYYGGAPSSGSGFYVGSGGGRYEDTGDTIVVFPHEPEPVPTSPIPIPASGLILLTVVVSMCAIGSYRRR